ncbi:MAG: hypothetical protein JWL77_3401 [Chthonomonadaceae bacterium]|nr:hypothetical protein [Chthonomonadaceae bacterium]
MTVYIGTSGWSYDHWEGVLYPPGLPARERLGVYLRRYNSVEVNSTFYRWPAERTFARWAEQLPDGFLMTIKAPRGLTHGKCLYAPERWLQTVQGGVDRLRTHRGVLLVQIPPAFAYDYARLAYFLDCVPAGLQVAMELRHPSWHREEVFVLLERAGAAYCIMSGAHLPCHLRATAGFVYVRLHGPDHGSLYAGSYSDDDLRWWADRIREWRVMGKTVFAYFNNDGGGNAVRNADTLRWMLS